MATQAHTMNLSRRQLLTGAAALAAAGVASGAALGTQFDAAAYVAMFETCGNVVFFDVNVSGQGRIGIYCPDTSTWPEMADIRHWRMMEARTSDWREKVIAHLKSRGQLAGYPPHLGI